MKKYEYASLKIGKVFSSGSIKHREIIDEYALKGYCYAGYVPTGMDAYGKVNMIDLIFEMDV